MNFIFTILTALSVLQILISKSWTRETWITSMYDHYMLNMKGLNVNIISFKNNITPVVCDKFNGLVRKQRKVCHRHISMMSSVALGAVTALRECRVQFQLSRWNCQTNTPHHVLNKVLRKGNRESAFLYAMSSAGVAHSVTRSCSRGELETCGCDRSIYSHPNKKGYSWSGCSDNIHFGKAYSKIFVDASEGRLTKRKKNSKRIIAKKLTNNLKFEDNRARKVINLHNNEVGRQVLESLMKVQCKCHGVSGSCEMRTCWRSLPNFHDFGNHLKSKFDRAVLVTYSANGLLINDAHSHKASNMDLVYINNSPSYCDASPHHGSYGTKGRLCNTSIDSVDSCSVLCCGRGYQTELEEVQLRCNCKFTWCCKVICDTCSDTQVKTRCK